MCQKSEQLPYFFERKQIIARDASWFGKDLDEEEPALAAAWSDWSGSLQGPHQYVEEVRGGKMWKLIATFAGRLLFASAGFAVFARTLFW